MRLVSVCPWYQFVPVWAGSRLLRAFLGSKGEAEGVPVAVGERGRVLEGETAGEVVLV